MDKKKLAMMFNADDDDAPPFQQKQLDEYKLAHYSQGVIRKSKREKEKEAADAKKREEEEKAAQAYAEFVDAFDSETPRTKSRSSGNAFVRAGGEGAYKPSGSSRGAFDEDFRSSRQERPPSPGPMKPKPKGKRAMDAFLEEIKRDQAERESRYKKYAGSHGSSVSAIAAYESQSGSRDRGDPATTNIFVANLPLNVDEHSLGMFFARMGPVGSVKIMWPRTDPTHPNPPPGSDISTSARRGMSGFVSYMTRPDAEAAVRELDGFDWGGNLLRVGWSKAVPIAARAMYGESGHEAGRGHLEGVAETSDAGPGQGNETAIEAATGTANVSVSVNGTRTGITNPPAVLARVPDPDPGRARPDADVILVLVLARAPTRALNPGYILYKHLMEGTKLPDPPLIFDEDGPHSAYSTDSGEESEREKIRKGTLGKLARKRFYVLLRGLSGKRGELARCMAFSLEHAESAAEVAEIIISSLVVDSTPVPRKIARLHLICDILHNSAASISNAWKFRQEFEARLGAVFDHLCAIYKSFPGRITAETFKKQVLGVVEVWEDWIVFGPDFTSDLRRRLDGREEIKETEDETKEERGEEKKTVGSKFKAAAFGAVTSEPVLEVAKATEENIDGEDIDGEDIDGEDLDGEAMGGAGGEDIDGEDIDGEKIDGDDIDGEAIDGQELGSKASTGGAETKDEAEMEMDSD
ncbi:RNA recognition motif protein [Ceratobasidium sp. AG-Ba]|nr:RNA recognition motif protein [Ceratobasidium sp. AG-Ba]QRW08045.1 RNA recognition motif protein [Ceratobasidium sp. AG-Ba]